MNTAESVRQRPANKNMPSPATSNRWLIYQQERFPLARYAPMVLAFSGSGLCLSYMTTGEAAPLTGTMFLVAFCVTLLTFLQLRICDEIKDCDIDARYHPERPVPRGLVSLKELKVIGVLTAIAQLAISLLLGPVLLAPLALIWSYMYLMNREFFVGEWLRAHPAAYMLSHMFVLFFSDLYVTSCHWMVSELTPPPALLFFFATSFKLGMVIEIGRKLRAPVDEREGVDTYTRVWGTGRAAIIWLAAIAASGYLAVKTVSFVGFALPVLIIGFLLFAVFAIHTLSFLRAPGSTAAKRFEDLSGLWIVTIYLLLGIVPLAIRALNIV